MDSQQTALTSLIGLEAGIELLGMVNGRRRASDLESVAWWMADFNAWHSRWEAFLEEHTIGDGRRTYTHERLRRARGPHDDPEGADAVRVYRGAEDARRVLAFDQQRNSGCVPARHIEVSSRDASAPSREGGLPVVIPAHREPAFRSGDAARNAH